MSESVSTVSLDASSSDVDYWKPLAERLYQIALSWENDSKQRQKDLDEFIETSQEVENALDADLAQSEERYNRLKADLNEKVKTLTALQERDGETKKKLVRVEDQYKASQERVLRLEKNHTELELRNDDLERKVRELEASVEDGRNKLEDALEQSIFLEEEKEQTEEAMQRLRERIQELEADVVALRQKPGADDEDRKVQDEEDDSLRKELEKYQEEQSKLLEEIESLKNNAKVDNSSSDDRLAQEKKSWDRERQELIAQLESLQKGEGTSTREQELLETIAKLQGELASLETEKATLETGNNASLLEAEVASLQEKIASLQTANASERQALQVELDAAKGDASSTVESLKAEITELHQQEEEWAEKYQGLLDELAKLKKEQSGWESEKGAMRKSIEDKCTECDSLKKDVERMKAEQESENRNANSFICDGLCSHATKLRIEVDQITKKTELVRLNLERQVADLQEKLKYMDTTVTEREERVSTLETKNFELETRIVEHETRNNQFLEREKEFEATQNALKEAKEHEKTLQMKMGELSAQLDLERTKLEEYEFANANGASDHDAAADLARLRRAYAAQLRTNASLLNRLQKVRGNIIVACRIRPLLPHEPKTEEIAVDALSPDECGFFDAKSKTWRPFAFDRVFSSTASQTQVSRDLNELGLAESLLGGTNACIMAYGQTGSGKTFTMDGTDANPGVNNQVIRRVFELSQLLENSGQGQYKIRLGMVEIYNDTVRDLLEGAAATLGTNSISSVAASMETCSVASYSTDSTSVTSHQNGRNRKNGTLRTSSFDYAWIECPTFDIVQQALSIGRANRATAATNLNEHSSRSHLVLVLKVICTPLDGQGEVQQSGELYLVDLAGSERVSKSGVEGSRLDEAKHINRSLAALGDVLEALDSKDRNRHVPYRNSKLTHLLQPALSGNSRMVMILTVPPSLNTAHETLFSLQFAQRARNIELGPAKRHVQMRNKMLSVQQLNDELHQLKEKNVRLENRVSELKRKQHLMEQAMAAVKSEGTKKQDAEKKRLEQHQNAALKEVDELRTKLQLTKSRLKEVRDHMEDDKRRYKANIRNIQQDKTTSDKKIVELEAICDRQRQELVKRQTKIERLDSKIRAQPSQRPGTASSTSSSAKKKRGENHQQQPLKTVTEPPITPNRNNARPSLIPKPSF